MERLRTEQPKGLSRSALRKWGMLFVILGIFGRSIIQNRLLGMNQMNSDQLLALMSVNPNAMIYTTVAIVLQFVETCAAPVFCLLLADGFQHSSNTRMYFLRVLGVALISEIPYNFAMSGRLLDMNSRNPVFGLVICLVLLLLYTHYGRNTLMNVFIKLICTFAAVIWCQMLRIDNGICLVVLVTVFWLFRKKPNIRNLMAGAAAIFCSLFSLYYMASAMGMMVVHFYNGEKGEENRLVSYLFYPAVLVLMGVVGIFAV